MTFEVFPSPPVAPEWVDAATADSPTLSRVFTFTERVAANRMFLRVTKVSGGCDPAGPPDPVISLAADTGDPVDVPMDFAFAAVFNLPGGSGGGGEQVAEVALVATEPGDVYLIRVKIFQPGSRWSIRFANTDPSGRRGFTWVVADNEGQTRQPWIDAPTTVEVEAFSAETATRDVPIANRGTGTLQLTDPDGTELGAGFTLVRVTPREVAPNSCALARVAFTPTQPPGPGTTVFPVASNDIAAGEAAGHNRRVGLTATRRGLPPGTILILEANDADGIDLFRVDPGSGVRTSLDLTAGTLRPRAVAVAADGSILVAGRRPLESIGAVVRVDPDTGRPTPVASAQLLVKPANIVAEGENILVADEDGADGKGAVLRINLMTGQQTVLAQGGAVFRDPVAVAVLAGSILMLAKNPAGDYALFRIDPGTGATRALVALASPRTFGLVAHADGRVVLAKFIQGTGGFVVRVRPTSGQQDTLAADETLHAVGFAIEQDGHLLIADNGNAGGGGVLRLSPGGGVPVMLSASSNPFRGPHAIALVPARDH